jgi:hypothetical protein
MSGKAGYSNVKKNIVSKLNNKQLEKHIPTTLQVYHVYHSSLQ